jgi:glycosyltransferase involved in cell wall biosynthesis
MPLLSVLMPVRNGEATVGAAIRSTLRALGGDAEIVVLNDASTDATVDVIEGVHDARVRVISSEHGVGVGGGLQLLLDSTDSRYVARMDADDVCLPWRFRSQLPAIERGRCDLLFSPIVNFRSGPLRLRPSMPLPISPQAMPIHLAVMCNLTHPTMIATRAAMNAAGGYRRTPAEDYDLWLRACSAGLRLARAAVPTLAYRRHDAQISFSSDYVNQPLDPLLVDAYGRFLADVLGVEVNWRSVPREDLVARRSALDVLSRTLSRRVRELGVVQRRLAERTMTHLRAAT